MMAPPSARLDLREELARPGGELRYVIVNEGDTPLLFGAAYGFERHAAEGWRRLPVGLAFPAWGAHVSPRTSTGEMPARVPQPLSRGRYRLTTDLIVLQANGAPVRGPDGPTNIRISREFSLETSSD
jgi:Bacterial Ig-like domain